MKSKSKTSAKDAPRESPRARVMRWLKESIASDEFPCGSEIPSARAVASLLGVAPNTVVTALDEAVASGLVTCRAGTRKRYAGVVRNSTPFSSAASPVVVLAKLDHFTDIATAPTWTDPFLSLDVVRRVSQAGRPAVLLNEDTLPEGGLDAAFAMNPAAMVVTNAVSGDPLSMEALARCREAGIHAVAYGNAPELRAFDRAYSDHRAGSRDLTRWLLARGRKRIVPFFPCPFDPPRFWANERLAGYAEAMREASFEPRDAVFFGSALLAERGWAGEKRRINTAMAAAALDAIRRKESDYPDALLCLTDDWARPAIAAIRDLGLDPARDIIVAGYDNVVRFVGPEAEPPMRPAVTVDKHNERTSEDLAALVLARIDGTLPPEPQARIHAHEVVEISQRN